MPLSTKVTLPIGIEINGKRHKEVTVKTMTVLESYQAASSAKDGEFLGLHDTAAQTTIDALGRTLTYGELANASKLDGDAINNAKFELEKKEKEQANESA